VGSVRGPRGQAACASRLDAGGPQGHPALPIRAPHLAGLLKRSRGRGAGINHSWGLPQALLGFAVGLVISLITAGAAESVTGYHGGNAAALPVAVIAANLVGLWIGLAGAALYASRRHGTGSLAADFGWRLGAWWELPAGAAVGLAAQYLLIPVVYLPFQSFDSNLSHQLSEPVHRDTGAAHTIPAVAVLLVFLAIGAPLFEELFFRGLLLRALLGRLPVPAAIVGSSVLFALAHFEAVQLVGLALFGVILAYMAWRTGRLGLSIGAHMAFNAAAVISVTSLR
jgi:membrane protease YdiL (CAAX protease family)